MSKPHIAVASLGGTITMTSGTDGNGILPTLGADELLAAVPALDDLATLSANTLFTVSGASLEFEHLNEALKWARKMVSDGNDGVVLVQGTDTIEESAYFFDLYWDLPEPLVVTGAMRSPQTTSSDGPANLLAAVTVAGDGISRGRGVLVVMNDEIHAASRVRKVRASGLAAFSSPFFGILGQLEEGRVIYGNELSRIEPLLPMTSWTAKYVAFLETHLGDQGQLLSLVRKPPFDGVVLSGFGVGHVSSSLAEAVTAAVETCPVVLTTRTGAGTTFERTYGFIGSESDLLTRGVVPAGWLDNRKSCVLLSCLLTEGRDVASIREEFAVRGYQAGGASLR